VFLFQEWENRTMAKKECVLMAGLGGLLMLSVGAAATLADARVGTPVPDAIANELVGGACNNTFSTSASNPVYCAQGLVGCNGNQIPDHTEGDGNSGKQDTNCGGGQRCTRTYVKSADCAA
jgi:hypothetical protein